MTNKQNSDHPGVLLGQWLRHERLNRGVVARVFAGRIELCPAKYAEVESGIVKWINGKHEENIPVMFGLDEEKQSEFTRLLSAAKQVPSLEFDQVYSRQELAPARCCTIDEKQITPEKKEAILDAVFTPLPDDD